MLYACAHQTQITPPVGIELAGFAAREQPSVGIHDDLYVRGLYLQEKDERLLWLHADLIGFTREQALDFRQQIGEALGLAPRQVLLSATHTHSGPATVVLRECGAPDPHYVAWLKGRLLEVARAASARPRRVNAHFVEGFCDLARDRRDHSALSHVDHHLPVLALEDENGHFLAVITNYGMHNVALSAQNRLISADVAGHAAEKLRAELPGEPVVFVSNGGCGNVNPPTSSADPAVMMGYGDQLAKAIQDTLSLADPIPDVILGSGLTPVSLPLMVLTPQEVETEYARSVASIDSDLSHRWMRAMARWRRETLDLLAQGAPDTITTDVQVITIGPVTFVGIGAEVFSRMAEQLRNVLGPLVYVIGYANGDLGYMPPREIYAEGGYEVDLAYKFYGHFMIAPGSYERVSEQAISLARSLAG